MDNCEARNTENFAEMKGYEFQWFWSSLRSLKKAANSLGVHGVIMSLLCLVPEALACAYYLTTGYGSASFFGVSAATLAFGLGGAFLVVGALLFIYNVILLGSVGNDQGFRVFKIIKAGCLSLLYLQIFTTLTVLIDMVILRTCQGSYPITAGGLIGTLVNLLAFSLTALAIYAIHVEKPKIFSLYIYIIYSLFLIIGSLIVFCGILLVYVALFGDNLGGFPAYLRGVGAAIFEALPLETIILIIISLIFVFVFVCSIMDYYLKIFVLHVNMMTLTPVNNLYHVNC